VATEDAVRGCHTGNHSGTRARLLERGDPTASLRDHVSFLLRWPLDFCTQIARYAPVILSDHLSTGKHEWMQDQTDFDVVCSLFQGCVDLSLPPPPGCALPFSESCWRRSGNTYSLGCMPGKYSHGKSGCCQMYATPSLCGVVLKQQKYRADV